MSEQAANAPPELVVVALADDPIDLDYLDALAAAMALPLGALVTTVGREAPAGLDAVHPLCRHLPCLPDDLTLENYWGALAAGCADTFPVALCVRAGTRMSRGVWRRLRGVEPGAGTVLFPLSAHNALSGAFATIDEQPGLDVEQVDQWLNHYAPGLLVDLPGPGGYSGLLTAGEHGETLRYLLTDAAYADDSTLPPQALPADLYPACREAFANRHPLTGLRHAMTQLSRRAEVPTVDVPETRPVNLHVSHGWGGGLARWIEDFSSADACARSLILKPIGDRSAYGQTIALVDAAVPEVVLRSRTLATPILSTVETHREYADFVQSIVDDYRVSALFVSSLIGHSMDLLRLRLPTVVVFHDFFPVCPAVVATYGGPCEHCDSARLEQCLGDNPLQKFFLVEAPAHWHHMRRAFAELIGAGHLRIAVPSASVERRLRLLGPGGADADWRVVPHGLPRDIAEPLQACRQWPPRGLDRPLVAVLGGAEAHKGGEMLRPLCEALKDSCDFLLLGFGEALDGLPKLAHVQSVPRYSRGGLGEIFAAHRPDLGLLLSTVPETFSFTLSELKAAAIPVLATRIGAFADRIEHGRDGWLAAPEVAAIAGQLRELCREPQQVAKAREVLLAHPVRDAAQMVEDYYGLLPVAARFAMARPAGNVVAANTVRERSLLVNPEVRYTQALGDFLAYTRRKLSNSPRVPRMLRRLALRRRG